MRPVTAIVYTSDTGFTAEYAHWLSGKTGLPCRRLEDAGGSGERVVYLGWLFAGSVKGLKKARLRYDIAALGVVGMSPTPNGRDLDGPVPAFYLPGGYRPERAKGFHKLMMNAMGKQVQKGAKTEEDRQMAKAFRQGCDWSGEAYLAPLLEWLKDTEATA